MTPLINQFTQFQLTDEEQLAGQMLTTNQLAVIQNLLAEHALKKINLNYTPEEPQKFLQQEAYHSGCMECLTYIIDCHQAATEATIKAINPDEAQSSGDITTIFPG